MNKFFSIVLAAALAVSMLFSVASAESLHIGEEFEFGADSQKPSNTGQSDHTQITEEQKKANYINAASLEKGKEVCWTYINEIVKDNDHIRAEKEDGYVLVYEDETPKSTLEKVIMCYDKMVDNDTFGYNQIHYRKQTTMKDLTDKELQVLLDFINQHYKTSYTIEDIKKFGWTNQMIIPDYVVRYIKHLLNSGGKYVRKDIVGKEDLIDFPTMIERQKALKTYLENVSIEDTVKTECIIEIKVQDTAHDKLYSSEPITWGDTGQTHYWQFECLKSEHDSTTKMEEVFAGPNLKKAFYQAGKYHVKATQILKEAYYDTITYTVNRYWVVAETGQVIYMDEITGSQILDEKPMREQYLRNPIYYEQTGESIVYKTMKEWNIDVQDVRLPGGIDSGNPWEIEFKTNRVG